MNFYQDIAHRLYTYNTIIGETKFSNPIDFIEAKHKEADFKGKVFYENLIQAMPNHRRDVQAKNLFKKVLEYCKSKMEEIKKDKLTENFESNKDYFDTAYKAITHTGAKQTFLLAEMKKANRAIQSYLENLPLSVLGDNLITYEGAIMYLEYLETVKSNNIPEAAKPSQRPNEKIKWKGDQKQLAELFITLEKFDWIEPIQDGQRQSICRNICDLFDISHTKKTKNSNEVNSFSEVMKADTDKKTKVKTYSKVYTPRYKTKFSGIAKRP